MIKLLKVPENQTYQSIQTITKIYPSRIRHYVYKHPYLAKVKGYEKEHPDIPYAIAPTITDPEENLACSLRRTKTTIQDIVLSNDFDLFLTFTFAQDRYDIQKSKTKMSVWLKNQKRIHGTFKYLIVPEYHKDRKAIHFHALFSGYKGTLKKTKHKKNGRSIFNVSSYKAGYSTAVIIDSPAKVSSYIRKYITKDMPQFTGKKRYWLSTGLNRPFIAINEDLLTNPFLQLSRTYEKNSMQIYEDDVTLKILTKEGKNSWNQLISTISFERYGSIQEILLKQAEIIKCS